MGSWWIEGKMGFLAGGGVGVEEEEVELGAGTASQWEFVVE